MKKALAILLSLVMALSVFGVAAAAFDSDLMTELPTQDSEDLYPGEYWYDFAGYLEYELANLAEECGGTESEEYQRRAEIFRNRKFYISSDHLTLYFSDDGERFAIIDITSPELDEIQMAYLSFLNQHQGDWTGYYLLPTADSDELSDGDYWFDLDGFIEWAFDNGAHPDKKAFYCGATYYLPTDNAGDHIIVCGENGSFEEWYVGEPMCEPVFAFLKTHISDTDFALLPTADGDELSDGDYWLDLQNLLDYWAAEGIKPVVFLGDYDSADYYINGSASVILIDFGEDDVEYYYAAVNTCDIFDFLYRHGMCDHRSAKPVPVGFQPCGTCDEYLILDGVTDPTFKNYSYSLCNDCGRMLAYNGDELVDELTEEEFYELGFGVGSAQWHHDMDDDGFCDNCGGYRLTEDVSDERYYLVVPDDERTYLRFAEIWACEKDGETVFDMMLEGYRFGYDGDDEEWEAEYAILSGWITAPDVDPDQAAAAAVDALIEAIGEVTLESGEAIETARSAYDALTDAEKALVSNYATLTAAEARYAELKAAETPTDPAGPADPTDPSGDNICKWDNVDHGTSFWGRLVKFFHSILYFFAHLFGRR